jgi:hypothetical protein
LGDSGDEERKGWISLCIPDTDPAERGFRPDLSNPRTYTGVRSTDPAGSSRKPSRELVARPFPADRPDAVDVRLQSKAGERKKNEEALRERWVSDMKRKKETTGKERTMSFKKTKNRKKKKKTEKEKCYRRFCKTICKTKILDGFQNCLKKTVKKN